MPIPMVVPCTHTPTHTGDLTEEWVVGMEDIQATGMDIPTTDLSLGLGVARRLPADHLQHLRRPSSKNDGEHSDFTSEEAHGASTVLAETKLQADA